ncbi:cupin domain-containing protein [Sporosarcina limicola]|uniref:Mannose-6-phosphate isomerase-like protein (Cupin superfamily) n=1 Tax=Sporosarcina limicola TaxID=34101 RepID=A0A927MLK1_9BACL|nr:cupin domain-containing protein [Sporosarcina limicola]MBE1556838.1 mannose-6-phosphate isomerase-like protein (cupin superfamily) [Sporosarcina limicola]
MKKPEINLSIPRFKEVDGHFHPAPFLLTEEMFGGVSIEIAGGEISELVGKPVANMHTHDVPEIYLLFSPEKGGAKIQVDIEEEEFIVDSPATIYIPAGMRHRFITLEAIKGSYCLGVLLNDNH